MEASAVERVAHLIQVALTPVFLLSAVGTLLNVFNTRLARVSDHLERTTDMLHKDQENEADAELMRAHVRRLGQRRLVLDTSVVMSAFGAVAACGAVFALFLGGVRDTDLAAALEVLFGVSLACTVAALVAFLADGVLAWHGLQREGPLPRDPKPRH